jgi:hypothetical protein
VVVLPLDSRRQTKWRSFQCSIQEQEVIVLGEVERRACHRERLERFVASRNSPYDGQDLDLRRQQEGGIVEERQVDLRDGLSVKGIVSHEPFSRTQVRRRSAAFDSISSPHQPFARLQYSCLPRLESGIGWCEWRALAELRRRQEEAKYH